eukprot:11201506-Lingulodinium_polyedra.AAC.1
MHAKGCCSNRLGSGLCPHATNPARLHNLWGQLQSGLRDASNGQDACHLRRCGVPPPRMGLP